MKGTGLTWHKTLLVSPMKERTLYWMVRQKDMSLESISLWIVFKLQWTIRMKHTKRRIDEWVYWAFSFHLSSCCFMLHSPLDNEYLSIFLKVINYSSASWFPVLTWPLLTEKYILSCQIFLPIMVVVRQWPAASILTVLNPGEYTARSGADIIRISLKLDNWEFILLFRNETPPVYIDRFCD